MSGKPRSAHELCAELERHFDGCSHDLDAIAQTLEAGFDKSGLYRHVCTFLMLRGFSTPCTCHRCTSKDPT